jgi:hypothetical protein
VVLELDSLSSRFLPTAPNVDVKTFNLARVNGGSNRDSLMDGGQMPRITASGWFWSLTLPDFYPVSA